MRNILVTIVVAGVMAVAVPRDLKEAATLMARAGVALINLALALYPDESFDAERESNAERPEQQDARLSLGALLVQFLRGTPMPQGRGCRVTRCERMWDHELQRPFRRCYWRCPRPSPPVEPPPRTFSAPSYEARHAPAEIPAEVVGLVLLGLVAAAIVVIASSGESDIDKDVAETRALTDRLEADAREADKRIARYLRELGGDDHG